MSALSAAARASTPPPSGRGQIDLRYVEAADKDDITSRIGTIITRSHAPGTRAELTVRGKFLPLTQIPAAERLLGLYADAAAASGFRTEGEFTGGCADSGFTAAVGTPALCAVGPASGNAHTATGF